MKMTKQQRQNLFAGILFVVFGIFELICASGIEVRHMGGDIGSALFPYVVGILVCVSGAIVIAVSLFQIRRNQSSASDTAAGENEGNEKPEDRKSVALGFACFVLYAIMLRPLGFIISSILFLLGMMNVMSPEKPTRKDEIVWLVISILVPVIVYVIFVYLLSVMLPAGILSF